MSQCNDDHHGSVVMKSAVAYFPDCYLELAQVSGAWYFFFLPAGCSYSCTASVRAWRNSARRGDHRLPLTLHLHTDQHAELTAPHLPCIFGAWQEGVWREQ